MKLYYMPGACSIGIHVLLEEICKPYDLQKIDGAKQEQYGPEFVKLNPKSKVPTLQRDDGSVLTEFPAIATWLARSFGINYVGYYLSAAAALTFIGLLATRETKHTDIAA